MDDEAQPGVKYIKPNIEVNLSDAKRLECRKIVQEIKNFGINQRQIIFLIDLLSLELEDLSLCRQIRSAVIDAREKMNQEKLADKLFIPGSSDE